LYDIASPLSNIEKYDGSSNSPSVSSQVWKQIYFEIRNASFDKSTLPEINFVKDSFKQKLNEKIITIAIIDYSYNKIKIDALKKGQIQMIDGKYREVKGANPYDENCVFVAAAINNVVYSDVVSFEFTEDFVFSNNGNIEYLIVNFGDGSGEHRIKSGTKKEIKYQEIGEKEIIVKAYYKDKSYKQSSFSVKIKDGMPTPDDYWGSFKADIPFGGELAEGNVAVYYGTGNTCFTEPVIIVDGFDPGDTRPMEGLYEIANQQNLMDSLKEMGMDAVLLNFYGGADYIQRNAMLVVKLLDTINQIMTVNGKMLDANQIVVVGPSMGGLITRYALTYMEQNNMNHNVRNWISFDSPQKGANIPLGLQHWVKFFADEAESEGAIEGKEKLSTPSAKQMLIYHFTATSGTTAGQSSLRTDFLNDINALGFPQQSRRVAIVNGSGYSNGQPYNAAEQLIEFTYRSFIVDLDGNVWAVPNQTNTRIFNGLYDTALPFDEVNENIYVNNTLPYDAAPGGDVNTLQEFDEIDPGYGDIIALYNDHCFIPTISSLCIQNTNDPFYNVNANINNVTTPFQKLYYPSENQSHVQITEESFVWFKHEVFNYAPKFVSVPVTSVVEDEDYEYIFSAIDENEWNELTFSVEEKPQWLQYDENNHKLYGEPENEDVGTYSVKIKVSDGLKETIQSFSVEVINSNDEPYVIGTISDLEVLAYDTLDYVYSDYIFDDEDYNDQLTITAFCSETLELPSWLVFDYDNHEIVATPTNADTGTYVIKVKATDIAGASDSIYFSVKVNYNPASNLNFVKHSDFEMYPNPAYNIVNFSFNSLQDKQVSIYSLNGELVFSDSFSTKNKTYDFYFLNKGVYLVSVKGNTNTVSKLLIIR